MQRETVAIISSSLSLANSLEASGDQIEAETRQLFLPYKGFCARKGLQMKEVVLDDTDISKALVDYIIANNIQNIVVGASNRNALTRKFRNPDVPSCLMKSAPEFCTVYVISKGKVVNVRAAKGSVPNSAMPPRQSTLPQPSLEQEESIRPIKGQNWRGQYPPSPQTERRSFDRFSDSSKMNGRDRPGSRSTPNNYFLDNIVESPARGSGSRCSDFNDSFSDDSSSMGRQSLDYGTSYEYSTCSSETGGVASPTLGNYKDAEADLQRLRLELKQTMDMYNAACKEAITAKQKAQELSQWKLEEARKVEQLRSTEEAALAMAETQKARCKAALEAAEAAQKVAELEARKRMSAEMKAKQEVEEKRKAFDAVSYGDIRYRKYSIDDIEAATQNFAEHLKIGEGGYGPVFKGYLDHTSVAIKILRPDAAQGRQQFQKEVEVLSCIRHPNMVLLLGACPEYGCLVYEYMDNGSLEDRLLRKGNTPTIPWPVRFKIAAEIATGLLFLHQTKPEPLVHRDLKPGNILLDRNYTSKIADVGLARLVPPSVANAVTQYHMTATAGTFCYIDPEYQQTGMLGTKSDIYSLGVMLLQIITAKSPMGLTHQVERAIEKGQFEEILDPTVTDWPVEEALVFAKLALRCTELRKKDRPDLGTVILPELNRLMNLGFSYENVLCGGGYGGGGYGSSVSASSYGGFSSGYDMSDSSTSNFSQ